MAREQIPDDYSGVQDLHRLAVARKCIAMPSDTTSAAQEAQVLAARRLGQAGRLRVAAELSEDVRRISVEGVLRRQPGCSFEQARRQVLSRVWGEALAMRVWPTTKP